MDEQDSIAVILNARLSQIATGWTTLHEAHGASPEVASEAQRRVLQRYGGAVYRYLLGATRDSDAADELFQEFALRFIRGDFHRATPERGRFREFLKTTLFHLVVDVQRRKQRQFQNLPDELADTADQRLEGIADAEQQFLDAWRDQLLGQSWAALQASEASTGKPLYTVLRLRAEHPQWSSTQMAAELSGRTGKRVSAGWIRKWLLHARAEFGRQLIAAVRESLGETSEASVEAELIEVGLWEYCRAVWSGSTPPKKSDSTV